MASLLNLVLLYGGKSGEHEISLLSAASVLQALDINKYNIIPVGIDKEGCCFLNKYQDLISYKESLPVSTKNSLPLPSLLRDGRLSFEADVVLPVVHGPLYEDGCLQGLLKWAQIPFVGCDVLASAIGMDKDIARRIACINGIQSAKYRVLSWHSNASERQEFCQTVLKELGLPLFVKPCSLGSSVGIHKVKNASELFHALEDALRYDETVLVEEFIQGREIEVAVLENTRPCVFPRVSLPGEIAVHHEDGFYSYSAKYLESDKTELIIPAMLNETIVKQVQKMAGEIFTRLKCKGMARVDFFVNEKNNQIYFNEINTIPGFTSISMYPKMWEKSGLKYSSLLDELINLALIHQHCREQLVTNYR